MTIRAAQTQGGDHGAEGGARALRRLRIMVYIGMCDVEAARHGIDIVPSLRHGEGDDADRGIGHRGDERAIALFDWQIVDHRAGHFGGTLVGGQLDQRCEAILRDQFLPHSCVVRADTCAENCPVQRLSLLHQPMQVPGLMRPVEIAEPDMHDAGGQAAPVIGRSVDTRREMVERRVRQRHRSRCLIWLQLIH